MKEQALNPPECTKVIKYKWLPEREWEMVLNGVEIHAKAEVEVRGNATTVSKFADPYYYDQNGDDHDMAAFILASCMPGSSKTWQEAIETEICYQADKIESGWETEYAD